MNPGTDVSAWLCVICAAATGFYVYWLLMFRVLPWLTGHARSRLGRIRCAARGRVTEGRPQC